MLLLVNNPRYLVLVHTSLCALTIILLSCPNQLLYKVWTDGWGSVYLTFGISPNAEPHISNWLFITLCWPYWPYIKGERCSQLQYVLQHLRHTWNQIFNALLAMSSYLHWSLSLTFATKMFLETNSAIKMGHVFWQLGGYSYGLLQKLIELFLSFIISNVHFRINDSFRATDCSYSLTLTVLAKGCETRNQRYCRDFYFSNPLQVFDW